MNFGMSTACLYPMVTEEALELLLRQDVKLFEVFFNTISEIEPKYLKLLKKMCDDGSGKIKSIHPFTSGYEPYLVFTNYERRFNDSLDFYKRYYEACEMLGAKIVVIHGDKKTPDIGISNEEYFEKFAKLSEAADPYGVTLAQENVNLFRSQHPAFICEMKEYLKDRAKFCLDIKQAVKSGNDPYEMCEAMGDGLVHVHINDNDENNFCLLPYKGKMDFNKLLDQLKKQKYTGDLILEVYEDNYETHEELVNSFRMLKIFCDTQESWT